MNIRDIQPLNFAICIKVFFLISLPSKHISKGCIIPSCIIDLTIDRLRNLIFDLGHFSYWSNHIFILFWACSHDPNLILTASKENTISWTTILYKIGQSRKSFFSSKTRTFFKFFLRNFAWNDQKLWVSLANASISIINIFQGQNIALLTDYS